MRPFAYSRPRSLDEAISQLGGRAHALAAGTDLLTLMKADLVAPERLLALSGLIPKGVVHGAEGLRLGAGTTLAEIERDRTVAERYTALAQAAALAASPQLRNVATVGGNLLQRPRCWYFRNSRVHCWLKGGTECQARDGENRNHALFGESPCVAVHPSDLAPALLAFEAELRVRGPQGERVMPLEELFALPEEPRRRETKLEARDLIVELSVVSPPEETRSTYLKAMDRQAFSFALAGLAAVLRISPRGRIGHARLVLSGVAPIPWRAHAAEQVLLGAEVSEALFEAAARAAVQGAAPLAHNAFKVPLAGTLVKRALQSLANAGNSG